MGHSPFAKRPTPFDPGTAKRRSTRVDYTCPVVLSGRDATGQPFREETVTVTINLHGCRLKTTHQVLVGMQVTVENTSLGAVEKAVCVHVWEAEAGELTHDVAVQLLKPQNMWCLENPPADWKEIAAAMVLGRQPQPTPPPVVAKPSQPPKPAPPPPKAAPEPVSTLDAETQLALLEQRAAQVMESVLTILRDQAEQIGRDSLESFRQQVEAILRDASAHIQQSAAKAYEETETALTTLRSDTAEQIQERTERVVQTAEDSLREKVGELFSTLLQPSPAKPPGPSSKK